MPPSLPSNILLRCDYKSRLAKRNKTAKRKTKRKFSWHKLATYLKSGIRIRFDPNTSHCIIKNFILLQQPQTAVINKHSAILTSPDFIPANNWIATSADLNSTVQVVEDVVVL